MVDFKRNGGVNGFNNLNFGVGSGQGAGAATETGAAGGTQGLDLSLPRDFSNFDSFEVSTQPAPTDARFTRALDTFNNRMDTILGHDAMALANGATPYQPGDELTDAQRDKMMDAAKDLLMEVPLDSLAPGLVDQIRGVVGADNLDGSSLNALGDAGGEMAKNFVENLRDQSPAVFYGLAGTAAVAAGVHGYQNGSEALRKLGLKPEFKTGLFNDRLEARASADWGPKFSDPSVELDLGTSIMLGRSGRLRAGISGNTNGEGALNLSGTYRNGDWSASGEARFETDGDFRAGVRARWEPNDRTEFAISGSVDNQGDARVGVGFKLKF